MRVKFIRCSRLGPASDFFAVLLGELAVPVEEELADLSGPRPTNSANTLFKPVNCSPTPVLPYSVQVLLASLVHCPAMTFPFAPRIFCMPAVTKGADMAALDMNLSRRAL